jgi:GntR family transcriptional regulator, transcriptional repressor for pyruvate dehydrogenase complex
MEPRSQLTRSDIAERLEAEVHALGSTAGAKLPSERDLAQRLGVGRPLIREAMQSLVERGLVTVSPGRGAFVRPASTTEAARPLGSHYRRQNITFRNLIEVRTMIEPPAARLAATRATEAELEALREAVERNDASKVVLERARWDLAIHRIVSRMPHNPMIETTFESIVPLIFELMLRSLGDRKVVAASAPYHRALYEAIRDRRPEDAYDAMLAHHESGRLVYDADLDSNIHEVAQRELAKLLGPSASMERVVSEVLREPLLAASVFAEPVPGINR